MNKISLNLGSESDPPQPGPVEPPRQAPPPSSPVLGYCAVGFGLLGIFGPTIIFSPLALICSVIALFVGQAVWALLGLMLVVAGVLTSPMLMGIIGLGTMFMMYDFNDLLQLFLDMFDMGGSGEDIRET